MFKKMTLLLVVLILFPAAAWSLEVYQKGDVSLNIGFWGQAWYQWVEDGRDTNNDGVHDGSINDFMFRRAYFSISGTAMPLLSFFVHYAADRIGQDSLDNSGLGLGSGLALRDGWITAKPLGNDLMFQMGRMYIPFTRNYGTTSTKTLLTTDLDWTQGGIRGTTFYPNKIGRDDGACVWGNVLQDKLQYRAMISEGIESTAGNPDDNLAYSGRLSLSILEPETGWFNEGTYLGQKHVLSLGVGVNGQGGLIMNGREEDYMAWTADAFYDRPVGSGGLTLEAAYISINNVPNSINYTRMAVGDDGSIISAKAGFLIPGAVGIGQMQPFVHYENLNVGGKKHTDIYGAGLNYFFKGHANKLNLDFTYVDQGSESHGPSPVQDHALVTLELAAGF